MPNLAVVDMTGKEVGTVELSEAIFGIEPNEPAMHRMVVNYLANNRQGTQSALTRTGHARQGSTRAPQWTHGGIVFAPKPRSYRFSVNKKVRRLALKSALSSKVLDKELIVVDSINADEYKTKTIVSFLSAVGADKKALIVIPEVNDKVIKSARNIPGVKTAQVNTINVYDILNADKLIIAKDALTKIEEVYA